MIISNKSGSWGLLSLLALFVLTYFIYFDFGIRYTYAYLLLCAFAAIIILLKERRIILTPCRMHFIAILAVSLLCWIAPHSNKADAQAGKTMICALVFIAFTPFMNPSISEVKRALKLIKLQTAVLSSYIILVHFYPPFYWNYIYPHLRCGAEEKLHIKTIMEAGYGVPIGGSTSYELYLISIAVLLHFSEILFTKKEKRDIRKNIAWIAFYMVALFFENRRSELLALLAVMLVLYFLPVNSERMLSLFKKVGVLLLALIFAVIVVLFLYYNGKLGRFQTMIQYLLERKGSGNDITSGRLLLWSIALKLFLEHPIFGIGWRQFVHHIPYYGYDDIENVHNVYLQWLCETGIVGFILLLIPTLCLCWVSFRQLRILIHKKNVPDFLILTGVAGFGAQLYFLLLNFIDPVFYHLSYFPIFTLIVALADSARKYRNLSNDIFTEQS